MIGDMFQFPSANIYLSPNWRSFGSNPLDLKLIHFSPIHFIAHVISDTDCEINTVMSKLDEDSILLNGFFSYTEILCFKERFL